MNLDFTSVFANYGPLLNGALTTLWVSFASVIIGGLGALLLSFVAYGDRQSPAAQVLRSVTGVYVSIFRGTPLLTQLILIFYVVPELLGLDAPPLVAAIIGLTLNTAAFQCEIYRSCLAAIPKGQIEAARMLGISDWPMRFQILFPQMFRLALPSLTNEIVIILKNSSLISVIAVTELMRSAQQIAATTFRPAEMYIGVAVIYLVMTIFITQMGLFAERKLTRRVRG
jgi:polar amino acid transport system permease protein